MVSARETWRPNYCAVARKLQIAGTYDWRFEFEHILSSWYVARARHGFHKAALIEIVLKLKMLTLNISFNLNATALTLCLPVKHSMFHMQTQWYCSSNKIEVNIWDWSFEFEHNLDSSCFVKTEPDAQIHSTYLTILIGIQPLHHIFYCFGQVLTLSLLRKLLSAKNTVCFFFKYRLIFF